MRVGEGQRLGAVTFLIASVIVYEAMLLYQPLSLAHFFLPWGDLMAGAVAVEVSGSKGSDGIYFLPKSMSLGMVRKAIGVEGEFIGPFSDATRLNAHLAAAISVANGGGLRVSDMNASTKLALGIPIDLNSASAEDLSLVPGIGQNLAAQIFQFRVSRGKIESLSELTAVPGIKERKVTALRKYLTVGVSQ